MKTNDKNSSASGQISSLRSSKGLAGVALEFALLIALPPVILVFPAVYLDLQFRTQPILILLSFALSGFASIVLVARKIKQYQRSL